MPLKPISSLIAYAGFAEQSQQGVAATPTNFIKWLDGTTVDFDIQTDDVIEGDGSRRQPGWIFKKLQQVKFKTILHARSTIVGAIEKATLGANADTYTGPLISTTLNDVATVNTTLSAPASAAASTFTVASTTGLTGSGSIYVALDAGLPTYEVVRLDRSLTSGSTVTIEASGTLRFAHASGALVTSVVTFGVGATVNTSASAPISAAAGSLTVASTAGLTGTGLQPVVLDANAVNAEIVVIDRSLTSGSTVTLANAGVTRFAHASGALVQSTGAMVLAANTGLTAPGTQSLVVSPGLASEEFVTIQTGSIDSATPFAFYTVTSGSASGSLTQSGHASGDTVQSRAQHVLQDQDVLSYWTWEFSLGGTSGLIVRLTDCMVDQAKRSATKGGLLTYEIDWIGIATTVQATALTPTFDAHYPFIYVQTYGGWTIDGSSSGQALYIEEFSIDQKQNLESIQAERLTSEALLACQLRFDVSWKTAFQDRSLAAERLFGNVNGTTDAQPVWAGSVVILFTQPNGIETLQYALPSLMYPSWKGVQPKTDGKHYTQEIAASATTGQGAAAYLLQTTLTNTKAAPY